MNQFGGTWRNPETNSEIELVFQKDQHYLLLYNTHGFLQEENIQILIQSEAAAKLTYCKRFSNGTEGCEAQVYIIGDHEAIIAGEAFQR